MATNLFDYFDDIATEEGAASARWAPRCSVRAGRAVRPDAGAAGARAGRRIADSLADLERIEAEPWVEQLTAQRQGGSGRASTAAGSSAPAAHWRRARTPGRRLRRLAGGQRFALNFWDANSTKALHIGHLRNLALGNALGGALEEAGGKVERRSIICDVGRSMGEAMAGVVQSGRHTAVLARAAARRATTSSATATPTTSSPGARWTRRRTTPPDSLTRELDVQDDSADELLQRVLDGDQQAIELWSKTRAWVISGQRKTLARLGIAFDRVFFESDFLPEVGELTELGLREGMLPALPRRRRDLRHRARGARRDAADARRRAADPAHARARVLDGGAGPRRGRCTRSRSAAPSGSPTSPAAAS